MGVGAGCTLSLLPSYIGEITEDHNRGQIGSIFGIIFTLGHLINYCIGPFVSFEVLMCIHLIPLLLFYTTFLPFVPETPYYFIARNDEEGAKRSLIKFRGHNSIEKELEQIKMSVEESRQFQGTFKDLIKSDVVRKGLIISCGLLLCQPTTGFTTVLAYMQPIFEVNKEFISPEYSVLVVGVCPLLANIFSTFIVEKLGRKILLFISSIGAAICLLALAIYFYFQASGFDVSVFAWLPVVVVIIFLFTNNMGFASIPWMMSGEVFSPDVKPLGAGLASSGHLFLTLILMGIFPYLSDKLGMSGIFFIFSGLSVLVILFIVFVVPETKGKSFAEIQDLLKQKSKPNNFP